MEEIFVEYDAIYIVSGKKGIVYTVVDNLCKLLTVNDNNAVHMFHSNY